MILKRFYNDQLAQASYLVGCPGVEEAAVIDPNRDIDQYLEAAAKEGLKITVVTETHIHADYVSGSRELAARTGARLYLSDEGDADWKYAFAEEAGATLVRDGDSFKVGAIRFDVFKTPGHTPEHISFVMTDEAASDQPLGIFSGDFVFVGDVGRPDLLENAAGIKNTARPGAHQLFHSLESLRRYPDHLLIWPAHGAGSACGKSLGGVPVSSLGYEKAANWAFRISEEESFVDEVLAGQPDPPLYFAEMKRVNKVGPAPLGGIRLPARRTDGDQIPQLIEKGAIVIDTRLSNDYLAAHIPKVLHLPLNKSFVKWAGWLVPYRTDIYILAQDEQAADTAAKNLSLIGLDQVVGWFGTEALDEFDKAGGELVRTEQVFGREVKQERNGALVLDVRNQPEWDEGHLEGARNIPLGRLPEAELPQDRKIIVHCQGGTRSAIASSVLERKGLTDIVNVEDGYPGIAAG